MPNETEIIPEVIVDEQVADVVAAPTAVVPSTERRSFGARGANRDRRGGPGGNRGPRRGGGDRERSEFAQKLIGIRRVARVMAGGRRFNFSVAIVLGDKKGPRWRRYG